MCTTMIITKGATANGAMVVTYSCDDEMGDQRIISVPAADHAKGSMRPILPENIRYPRLVRKDRGPYYDTPGWEETKAIGEIPQVAHTFAYYDGGYGIMNEHSLMIGECTNGARFEPDYVTAEDAIKNDEPMRIMFSTELSRIALERCTSASDAVDLMGELIDAYGYYGTGETLLVADLDEAWVFEMAALPTKPFAGHHSAWIAQRVPDGEIFVATNVYRIRDVTGDDPDQKHSDHLLEDLEAVGYWDPKERPVCDWMRAISAGEYNHPYYSLRRIWRVFDRVNPDLAFSPWVEDTYTRYYPFSVKPNRKLTREEIFGLYRDHYEGTEFDMTKGVAAGPYGDPHRFTGYYDGLQNNVGDGRAVKRGAWERSISIFYQGYTYVLESRPETPPELGAIMWLGPDVSYTTVYTPFWAGAAGLPDSEGLPVSYQTGNPREYDPEIAFWVFDFIGSWARLNWQRMTEVDIKPLQRELEAEAFSMVADVEARLKNQRDPRDYARKRANKHAAHVLSAWTSLGHKLIAKYAQGYVNAPPMDPVHPTSIGYPAEWLAVTNYAAGPTGYAMPTNRAPDQRPANEIDALMYVKRSD